jgi:chorismate mutase/prephenate dehydratase
MGDTTNGAGGNAGANEAGGQDIGRRRAAIDALDARIVRLLNERAGEAREIGKLKGEGPAYSPEREAEVLERIAALGEGPLTAAALRRIYVELISACRALEQKLCVSFLGPEGTFSEMALYDHFGRGVEALSCPSIDEVFRAAEKGTAHYALVPVENSTEGAIGRTLDLLLSTPLRICGEVVLRVVQNLMVKGGSIEGVSKVYSHPQSLAQCHGWLSQNLPRAERIPLSSNAEAARRAAIEPGTCAIGPAIAAERYGLAVFAPGIEDDSRNKTRFLVLGAQDTRPTGRDRTSLAMTAHNRPGAMHELIAPFARNGVSMSRIESRPARTGQWEYYFYVDLEGHQQDAALAKALAEVRAKAPFVKVFGSYPAAAA